MRVLIVSQYYPPEAVPLPADLARSLAERGHSVRVLTGYPNYPLGRVFPGYRQRWRHRELDGDVVVHRTPLFADHSQSAVRRMANYASFALTSALARRSARGADVVYVYATQMTAALGPWIWRALRGAPYVLHVQDLWPDSIVGSSMVEEGSQASIVARLLSPWLTSVYRRAAGVIGIAPTMVETLTERGVPRDRAHLVYNWADAGAPQPEQLSSSSRGRTSVVYAGNVGDMQDLATAVRAAHETAEDGIALTIVGDGVAREGLRELVDSLGATNVLFRDPVPRERMPEIYAEADFGLVSLKDMPVFRGTIPSKFQAVLAAGVPVVTTVQGDVRAFVRQTGVGLSADAEDVASLASAFREAANTDAEARRQMSSNAAKAYAEHFSRESGIGQIERILSAAAEESRRGR